jgi:ABC-type sugar transport system permease subunit
MAESALALVDGANSWQKFVAVILPEIGPVTGFVVLLSLLGSFQLFALPFTLLNGPGPENRVLTVVMYLYQYGFEVGDLGYASAIGWTLALVLMGCTVLQRLLSQEH